MIVAGRRIAVGVLLIAAAFAGCSLGLDESLIARGDAGLRDAGDAAVDSGDTGLGDAGDGPATCTTDEDCKTTHACLTAKCDVANRRCVFPVCRVAACTTGVCEGSACQLQEDYAFRAGQFPVGVGIGCGGNGARCLAAVHPFLFVGTTTGVVAFDVSNPRSAEPRRVPIVGLGFLPSHIVASGNRVFFMSGPAGAGGVSRVAIAYADVPTDPFAAVIKVNTVLAFYERPPGDGITMYPRSRDTALFVNLAQAASYPSGVLEPPLVEPYSIALTPIPSGLAPATTSGDRLAVAQVTAAGVASFALVTGAGGPNPLAGNAAGIPGTTPVGSPAQASTNGNGTVVWSFPQLLQPPDFDAGPIYVRAVKTFFVVPDRDAGIDARGLDVTVYAGTVDVPNGTALAGPVSVLDPDTALVATAIPATLGQTQVQVVRREPLALATNAPVNDQPKRYTIPLPPGQLAATSSNGIAYVLAVDGTKPTEPTIYAFDPACPAP